jgi:hypothetical protein
MQATDRHPARRTGSGVAAACLLAMLCAGCAGRYVTRTEYLAPDFSRASIRGRTVAVIAATDGPAGRYGGELAGVARGMRDAGARVRLVDPPPRDPSDGAAAAPAGARDRVALLADFAGDPDSDATRRAARRWARDVEAQYLLFVRVTDSDVVRAFTPAADAGPPRRETGRRVGLRLALVRVRDSAVVWVASGTGEAWTPRPGPAAAARPSADRPATDRGGAGEAAATVDDDLDRGHLPLYPPPPPAQDLASRLTRRLLARVPLPVELEPN